MSSSGGDRCLVNEYINDYSYVIRNQILMLEKSTEDTNANACSVMPSSLTYSFLKLVYVSVSSA